MSSTPEWNYYDEHTDDFIARTISLSPAVAHERFLAKVAPGARVLDAGFGSARDLRYFLTLGYDAHGIDASFQLTARALLDLPTDRIRHLAFEEFNDPPGRWDAIWAMAGLIHVDASAQTDVISRLLNSLVPGGFITAYYRCGDAPHTDSIGRYIFPLNEQSAENLCHEFRSMGHEAEAFTETGADSRGNVIIWIGITITKRASFFSFRSLSEADRRTRHTIAPELQEAAVRRWLSSRAPQTTSGLGYEVDRQMGGPWTGPWPFSRAADRVIQRMRKEGLIEVTTSPRGLQITPKGRQVLSGD